MYGIVFIPLIAFTQLQHGETFISLDVCIVLMYGIIVAGDGTICTAPDSGFNTISKLLGKF